MNSCSDCGHQANFFVNIEDEITGEEVQVWFCHRHLPREDSDHVCEMCQGEGTEGVPAVAEVTGTWVCQHHYDVGRAIAMG